MPLSRKQPVLLENGFTFVVSVRATGASLTTPVHAAQGKGLQLLSHQMDHGAQAINSINSFSMQFHQAAENIFETNQILARGSGGLCRLICPIPADCDMLFHFAACLHTLSTSQRAYVPFST